MPMDYDEVPTQYKVAPPTNNPETIRQDLDEFFKANPLAESDAIKIPELENTPKYKEYILRKFYTEHPELINPYHFNGWNAKYRSLAERRPHIYFNMNKANRFSTLEDIINNNIYPENYNFILNRALIHNKEKLQKNAAAKLKNINDLKEQRKKEALNVGKLASEPNKTIEERKQHLDSLVKSLRQESNPEKLNLRNRLQDRINQYREDNNLIDPSEKVDLENPSASNRLLNAFNNMQKDAPILRNQINKIANNPTVHKDDISFRLKHAPRNYKPLKGLNTYEPGEPITKNLKNQPLPPVSADWSQRSSLPEYLHHFNRAALEAAIDLAARPDQIYPGPHVADLSTGEEEAHEQAVQNNSFNNPKTLAENEAIRKQIEQTGKMPKASEVANPYLERAATNPADYHNDLFGKDEADRLRQAEEAMDKDYYEKTLPLAIHKYMVPGLRGRGHKNTITEDMNKKYFKMKQEALQNIKHQNRILGLEASQKHAATQGQSALTAGTHALNDITAARNNTETANLFNQQKRLANRESIAERERIGRLQREMEQEKINAQRVEFQRQQDMPMKNLAATTAIAQGSVSQLPSITNVKLPTRSNPSETTPNAYQGWGAASANLGNYIAKQNEPQKYADGGSVMGQAVQNAVIDQESPLHELRRLMNRQRLEQYQKKSVQRRFRSGGLVSPIQSGAQKAKSFMAEDEMRNHYESLKTPPVKKATITGGLEALMSGYASLGGTNATSQIARNISEQGKERDLEEANQQEKKLKAFEQLYKMDIDKKAELAALRKEERQMKKLAMDERLTNAQIGKLSSESQFGNLDQSLVDPAIRKQTRDDKKAIQKANDIMAMASRHKHSLENLKPVVNIATSPTNANIIKNTPLGLGYPIVSLKESVFGKKGSKAPSSEELKTFEDKAQEAFQSGIDLNKTTQSAGGRFTNMSHQALESSKVGLSSYPSSNTSKIDTGEIIDDEIILEAAKMKLNAGVDPKYVEEELNKFDLSLSNINTGSPKKEKLKQSKIAKINPQSIIPSTEPAISPVVKYTPEEIEAEKIRRRELRDLR